MASCRASAGGTVPGCGLRWGRYLSLAEQRPEWDEDGVTTNISGGDFKFGGFCFGSDFLLLCSVVLQFLYFCSMLANFSIFCYCSAFCWFGFRIYWQWMMRAGSWNAGFGSKEVMRLFLPFYFG